ncbi:MAG TPA: ATP-dependent 6-phosphofructokinase [Chthoniobacterales bacterium]|jgi:6-phosphofructokinase 1
MGSKRIGVLTSGGDCPGLNAVLRAVVRAADGLGWEVLGFRDGFEGLLPEGGDYMVLDRASTTGIMHTGGTLIGTTNRGHFVSKVRAGEKIGIPREIIAQARRTFDHLELDALIAIGGDGSLSTALQLSERGFPVIGVPKTIDNDLEATAMTFGFDSAVSCVTDSLDRLHTTATSHKRVMVLEVMGRHAGWIALYGGLAGGADVILIPEIPFQIDRVVEQVRLREAEGYKSTMIVVAEGASPRGGRQSRLQTSTGEYRLGGIGEMIGREIGERTRKDTRVCVLGHLQRGGAPTSLDRILGTRFGVQAVKLIQEEAFGSMVSYQNYQTRAVPLAHAVHRLRRVDPHGQMMETARAMGITFGD